MYGLAVSRCTPVIPNIAFPSPQPPFLYLLLSGLHGPQAPIKVPCAWLKPIAYKRGPLLGVGVFGL